VSLERAQNRVCGRQGLAIESHRLTCRTRLADRAIRETRSQDRARRSPRVGTPHVRARCRSGMRY
jgi:hypothetical protein